MTISKKYKVLANGEVQTFITQFNEREFLKTLDSVYGVDNYSILEVSYLE